LLYRLISSRPASEHGKQIVLYMYNIMRTFLIVMSFVVTCENLGWTGTQNTLGGQNSKTTQYSTLSATHTKIRTHGRGDYTRSHTSAVVVSLNPSTIYLSIHVYNHILYVYIYTTNFIEMNSSAFRVCFVFSLYIFY